MYILLCVLPSLNKGFTYLLLTYNYQQYLSKTTTKFRFERISVKSVIEALKSPFTMKSKEHLCWTSLQNFFSKSLETGTFPSQFKTEFPCTQERRWDWSQRLSTDLSERSVFSVSPTVSKLFERIIYDQLCIYLSSNSLLIKHQSGFRSLHYTATALLEATNEWYFNVDQGNVNLVVFLDLSKAFDTVSHHIL